MENFKKEIDELSNKVLNNSGIYRKYSDEDLSNAMIIFFEVFTSKMYNKHSDKLPPGKMELLAIEAGKSIKQNVELFTGVNLSKIYDKRK